MASFRCSAQWRGAIILVAAAALAGQVTVPAAAAAAARARATWSVQPTPNARVANGALAADSCTGPAWCMAVGSTADSSGTSALAEAWNGTAWRALAVPIPPGGTRSALDGVSCTAATACTAVGSYTSSQGAHVPLAEEWNGTSWSAQPTPGLASATFSILSAVSCGSATSCVAVGYYDLPHSRQTRLAESWNGTAWSLQQAANPPTAVNSTLSGVSCATVSRCIAVGNYLSASSDLVLTLAQAWNGRTWKVLATPNPAGSIVNYLNGVWCSSATACTAVGDSIAGAKHATRQAGPLAATLAEAWNGTAWVIQDTPSPAGNGGLDVLDSVSCRSAASCVAIGYLGGRAKALGETWNGTTWALEATPDPGRHTSLAGVSCGPAAACTAVGTYRNGLGTHLSLAQVWNGSTWTLQAAVSPVGAVPSDVVGVSCPSVTVCTAVGFFDNGPGTVATLAEHWNGTAWAIQPTPNPAGAARNSLASVSCTSAKACIAVGKSRGGRSGATLAESWNGKTWTVQSAPTPPGAFGGLAGVSCTSRTACIAVGSYTNAVNDAVPLAESWNGTSWTIQNAVSPPGSYSATLSGVSCGSSSACVAVGDYNSQAGIAPLAEYWNGSTWTVQSTPRASSVFDGVSCASAVRCTAAGEAFSYPSNVGPLAEVWQDGTWRVQKTPAILAFFASFYAVSCRSAAVCTAVGNYLGGSGASVTLAEDWNGKQWAIQRTVSSPNGSTLAGVSCPPSGPCIAVGSQGNDAGVSVTLAEAGPG